MKHRFFFTDINNHCALVKCEDCWHEVGFTAVDTFATMVKELSDHDCGKGTAAADFDLYNEYLLNVDLRN